MEKRFMLAFALSLLIMLGYPVLLKKFAPSPAPRPAAQTAALKEAAAPITASAPVAAPAAEAQHFPFENAVYRAVFTSHGGGISSLSLKGFESGKTHGNFLMDMSEGVPAAFSTRVLEEGSWIEGEYAAGPIEPGRFTFSREKPGMFRVTKTFSFMSEQFAFGVDVKIENLSSAPQTFQYELVAPLLVSDTPDRDKMNLEADYFYNGQMEMRPAQKLKQGFLKDGPLDWVALEKKYFTLIVKPEAPVEHVRSLHEHGFIEDFLKPASVEIPAGGAITQRFFVFAGPKRHEVLKSFGEGFEKILHTKVLGGLWILFLNLLNFFYKLFHNYGVAIIVLSSAIKLVFAPLTHMSFESMRKMQALQPKMKALQEQYKNDPQKMNREVMELYKKHKVNPFGGCLPLVLQMPIFVALYQTFSQAMELRGAPFFGWIRDLSEPDTLFTLPYSLPLIGNQVNVLPIIMIGTMLWQQKVTPQPATTKEQQMMTLMMPVIFGFIFYGLPSGLVIYWIVNNVLTIAHQLFMKQAHINPSHAE